MCTDVPIARIGIQDYLNSELINGSEDDMIGGANGIIQVERREADVFRPETIASFEGKDVVVDHPDEDVAPHNYKEHTVGVTLNPRRGEGDMSSFLIADLLIKDQAAIESVRAGEQIEVSCGYDAEYESLGPGRARQYDIIGNHVALVDRGRCGRHCSIGDSEMKVRDKAKNGTAMSFIDRLAAAFSSKDKAAFDAGVEGLKGELGIKDEEAPLEVTGTHVHIHMPGEKEAAGAAPAPTGGAQDEEGEEPHPMEGRVSALESNCSEILALLKKMAGEGEGEGEGAEGDAEQQGEEEAEGDVPNADADPEEGETPPMANKKAQDAKKAKDAAVLVENFRDALSGAEILAPGLKLPTFDKAADAKKTTDSICLLKRRALAAFSRTDDGAEVLNALTGKKTVDGAMPCSELGVVFNGAVAMTKDRETAIEHSQSNRRARDTKPVVENPRSFNDAMRAHYKQQALRPQS